MMDKGKSYSRPTTRPDFSSGSATDVISSCSAGTATALQHLQELAGRMKTIEFPFLDIDVCVNIMQTLAKAIRKLDEERIMVHTVLETETITSSILRHQLQFFPDRIQGEITTAVESARQSNADELKALQDMLKTLNDDIGFLDEKHRKLNKQNAILHPERDMVRTQHEEVISQLNQRMADKANKQIKLNETRDELRDTNQKIVDLETGIMILKEDMIQERADARREKKHLKQCVHDTTKTTKRQKEANVAKKKELDVLQEELVISENELADIRKLIRRHEANKARYENQQCSVQEQLDRENTENVTLKERGVELGQHLLKLEKKHLLEKTQMEHNLMELDNDIIQTNGDYDALEDQWNQLKEESEDATQNREIDSNEVQELDTVLQAKKEDLTRKASETARMKQENDEMELRMKQLEENHEVTVQLLGKQISDFRVVLARERKERIDLQEKRDTLTREIDDFKLGFAKFMYDMNSKINQSKKEETDLLAEGSKLQKDIHTDVASIEKLTLELQKKREGFDKMKSSMDKNILTLQMKHKDMKTTLAGKQADIEKNTPAHTALEELFVTKTREYEDKKKSVVQLKNQKSGLEDTAVQGKREIVKLSNPSVTLRAELKQQQTSALSKMKNQAQELQQIEECIYQTGRKLTAVTKENDKFHVEIAKLESDCQSVVHHSNMNGTLESILKDKLLLQRELLIAGWQKEQAMQEESASRDRCLLDDITELQQHTGKRERKITDITEKLHNELLLLAKFLNNVADRRPQNTSHCQKMTPRPPTILNNYLESFDQLR